MYFILIIIVVVVQSVDTIHDDHDIQWRCIFRCGVKKQKSLLGKTNTICQDIGYVFYLNHTVQNEQSSLDQCNQYFNDITSDPFQQSKYFCSFSRCNPPIAKEILPPLDYRHNHTDESESTLLRNRQQIHSNLMRINPVILQKLGDLDRQRLESIWNKENMQLNEDHLLQQIDKQILQMKVDLCTDNQQLRESSELKLQKLSFFISEVENGVDPQKAMLLGLVGFSQFTQTILQPYIKSIETQQLSVLNDKLKSIVYYLRDIQSHCIVHKRMKTHDINYSPQVIQQVKQFIRSNQQHQDNSFK